MTQFSYTSVESVTCCWLTLIKEEFTTSTTQTAEAWRHFSSPAFDPERRQFLVFLEPVATRLGRCECGTTTCVCVCWVTERPVWYHCHYLSSLYAQSRIFSPWLYQTLTLASPGHPFVSLTRDPISECVCARVSGREREYFEVWNIVWS